MRADTIEIQTADGPMAVYEVEPDEPRGTAVVVVQEAFGVNEHIEDVTRRVAAAGHHAVAPHVFHRSGGGTVPYGQFDQVLAKFEGMSDDTLLVDLDATLAHLDGRGFAAPAVGAVGFCMGGRATFLLAAERAIGAAVGFYGGGIVTARFPQFPALVDRAAGLRTPWLGLFGDDDGSIPVADVEAVREAVAGAPVPCEVVRYAGAGHGFNRDVSDDFRPEAAADAWSRTLAWFERHLTS